MRATPLGPIAAVVAVVDAGAGQEDDDARFRA